MLMCLIRVNLVKGTASLVTQHIKTLYFAFKLESLCDLSLMMFKNELVKRNIRKQSENGILSAFLGLCSISVAKFQCPTYTFYSDFFISFTSVGHLWHSPFKLLTLFNTNTQVCRLPVPLRWSHINFKIKNTDKRGTFKSYINKCTMHHMLI